MHGEETLGFHNVSSGVCSIFAYGLHDVDLRGKMFLEML